MDHPDFAFSPYSWPPTSTTLFPLESISPLSTGCNDHALSAGFNDSPLSTGLNDEELQAILTNLDLAQSSSYQNTITSHPGAMPINSPQQSGSCSSTWQPIPRSESIPERQSKRLRATSDFNRRRPARSLSDTSETSNQDSRPRCFEHGCNGRTFSNMDNYKRHLREQRSQTSIQCPFCGKEFSRKSNMDTHVAKKRCKVVNTWLSDTNWSSA